MKTFKIFILSTLLLTVINSCNNDVLNIQPDTKISSGEVFQSVDLAKAYIANLYQRMPFYGFEVRQDLIPSCMSDEAVEATGYVAALDGGSQPWDYKLIRDMNVFLENIMVSPIADASKSQMEGEVRVLRAYLYYQMQKRWGGVPLVDVVIDPYGEIDTKYQKRSTEEAIANFIDTELAAAANLLPEDAVPQGRINKWAALALKARTNLWAASIAKYGTVQLDGLVGIPASRANEFFTKSSEAANAVIQSEKYLLYNKIPNDKSENYQKIFMDEENSEVIWEIPFDGINMYHKFDNYTAPNSVSDMGAGINPTLEFLLGYENIDGSTDQPQFGTDHLYADGREPFIKKDPRLFGTVFFQGDSWVGVNLQTYEGTDPSVIPDPSAIKSNYNNFYNGRLEAGEDSRSALPSIVSTNSGFLQKKYIDDSQILITQSSTNWIIFRLAEMYLTRAEAEFEQGHLPQAVDALNYTRQRAGISLVNENTITLDKVRTERRSEMAFENLRYWDLRRWHTAESALSGYLHGLRIIYHASSQKYYFLEMEAEASTRDFEAKRYYNAISQTLLDNNPLLVQNPGYN